MPQDQLTEREQALAVRSYQNHQRAERAEQKVSTLERKLHAAGEGLADAAITTGRIDKGERDAWVRSFESDPGKVMSELESAEKRYAEEHEAMYGGKPGV